MDVRTYRAPSMQDALALVRRDLGPSAAVLHTREVRGSTLLSWIPGFRRIEVTAARGVNVPSKLPARAEEIAPDTASRAASATQVLASQEQRLGRDFQEQVQARLGELAAMMHDLRRRGPASEARELPANLFRLYTDLIDADVSPELAREIVDRVSHDAPGVQAEGALLKTRAAALVQQDIQVTGPIRLESNTCRLVALVGPTGVGKTTTIAKLAAHYRLREKRRVGLITVDTYRIAAVEQLRTYADIIDLPMKVVSTPREMRQAVAELQDLDLILLDTAGRSPRDDVKIQELKSLLLEAEADEVHLVLSSVTGASTLLRTAERFGAVQTTAMILTKLDEATSLGHLLPLLRQGHLPLSYLTFGQNVPDDIAPAQARKLARWTLGLEVDERGAD